MPFIIIDKDDHIIEIVTTIEEASRRLKELPGARCEQLPPISEMIKMAEEELGEEEGDGPVQEEFD